MRTHGLIAVAIAALALVACGGKNKKPKAPEATTAVEDDTGPEEKTAQPEATADATDLTNPADLEPVIYFEFDKSDLSEESRETLNENAEWLKEDPKRTLLIEGHTDEVGPPEYNLGLGDRRARAARDYLIRLGIAGNRIKIITYGEEKPVSNEDAENRRSVFVATKK